jgi:hypothetical protein
MFVVVFSALILICWSNIAESMQRRIANLHQNTAIGSTDITDLWEPLEEGLLPYVLLSNQNTAIFIFSHF